MNKNNTDNTLLLVGLIIITMVNILEKLVELNKFIAIGLDLIALMCFIVYLIKSYKK